MAEWMQESPERAAARLRELGPRRVFVRSDPAGSVRVLPETLEPAFADFFAEPGSGFAGHEAVFLEVGRRSGSLCAAFLHDTQRGQAQGGLRRWRYATLAELLRDGLRLSRAMTRKNALAGLWWGGGKGILAAGAERGAEERARSFLDYGDFVTSLRGCYVTAEDVGTSPDDLVHVFERTRFVTCVPPEIGGSGNPSAYTARGVVCALEAALDFRGLGSARGSRVAMQGGGAVGEAMVGLLLERGVSGVVVADVSAERCRALARRFPDARVEVRHAKPGDVSILGEPCDVLAPNAVGGVLGSETIPGVRAAVVCGAANNPLVDEEEDARALVARGITYVPDFVANRLGIVHCANEQYGYVDPDPALEAQLDPGHPTSVPAQVKRVLETATREGISSIEAARRLADAAAAEPHPIWPGRAQAIVRSLAAARWWEG